MASFEKMTKYPKENLGFFLLYMFCQDNVIKQMAMDTLEQIKNKKKKDQIVDCVRLYD